ncbi:hypothetical protein ACRALDRAFT_1056171 [Sodiomyces alcalophilus JCM 7366]|uniref:uncharacterized protein n=1 Tax=Sodiomyces alcalophilus JCM 7366 TaxID=591952 RepID=UPI0039B574B6
MAAYMASVPRNIRALVEADECKLPSEFTIRGFSGESDDGGDTLDLFEFSFQDDGTGISTLCQFNSSSEAIVLGGRTPRYACHDPSVHFIWQDTALTMIEKTCPDEQGQADFEAAGTAPIEVVCGDGGGNSTGACVADSSCHAADVDAQFFSFSPVPT